MNRRQKILISLSLLLLAFGIVVLRLQPTEYRISMYGQVPLFLLIGVSILSLMGVISAVYDIWNGDNAILSYTPIYLYMGGLILLPWLLGYVVRYGDPMVKLGNTRDVISGEALESGLTGLDKYPLFHFDVAIISVITDQSPYLIMGFLSLILAGIFLITIISIGRYYRISASPIILFVPLVFHSSLRSLNPSSMAYLTIFPSLLLVYHHLIQRDDYQLIWSLLFFILGAALWVQHLFIAMIAILVIGVSVIGLKIAKKSGFTASTTVSHPSLTILLSILGFIWFRYGPGELLSVAALTAGQALGLLYRRDPHQPIPDGDTGYLFSELGFSIIDVGVLAFYRFGGYIILLGVGGLGGASYLILARDKRPWPYVMPAVVIIGLGWALVELTIGVVPSINWIRILRLAAIGAPILCGWIVIRWVSPKDHVSTAVRSFSAILLAILLITGLFATAGGMYGAPHSTSGNSYTTNPDIEGWNWFFDHKVMDETVITLGRDMTRYAELSLTAKEEEQRIRYLNQDVFAPAHFQTSNGTIFNRGGIYYMSDQRSQIMHLNIGNTDEFTEAELDRVRHSTPQVNVIYDNGFTYFGRT